MVHVQRGREEFSREHMIHYMVQRLASISIESSLKYFAHKKRCIFILMLEVAFYVDYVRIKYVLTVQQHSQLSQDFFQTTFKGFLIG